ncbi:insulinase family protein [Candidatus Peregrinibacteria bacterium]|nr:insulinase family protein [Candidatus Peregrinibacteria bacterium]
MHKLTTLPNGLRIVVTPVEGTKSVTVLVLAGAGSRFENKSIKGVSHFLEHLFFKGGERFKNAGEVSAAIDSVGGDFNAFTGKEYAGYYVKLASHQKEVAFDVIGDMLLNATFINSEIDKERGVILEEYNMYQDTPMYQVGWDFERLIFGDQPMGWDQIGEMPIIKSVTRDEIVHYKNALYTPDNVVISVAGHVTEKEVLDLVTKYFPFGNETRTINPAPYVRIHGDKRVKVQNKKTEQGHLILGTEGLPALHKDEYVEKVLSVILGGNMSSRMFMNVREAKGLSYYIRTSTDDYSDAGVISTSAGVDLKRVDLAITAILEEYRKITEEKVSEAELTKGKEFMKGKIILRLEDSEEYAHLMGKQALLYPKIENVNHILQQIDAVTADDILRLSRELFQEDKFRLALIGPFEDPAHFEKLLHY